MFPSHDLQDIRDTFISDTYIDEPLSKISKLTSCSPIRDIIKCVAYIIKQDKNPIIKNIDETLIADATIRNQEIKQEIARTIIEKFHNFISEHDPSFTDHLKSAVPEQFNRPINRHFRTDLTDKPHNLFKQLTYHAISYYIEKGSLYDQQLIFKLVTTYINQHNKIMRELAAEEIVSRLSSYYSL